MPDSKLLVFSFKKDMPKLGLYQTALRVDFGLLGHRYVISQNNCFLCADGSKVPFFAPCLVTPGFVIGLKYDDAAKHKPWAEEWRQAFHGAIKDRLQIA